MKDGRAYRYDGVLDIPERTIGKWAIKHEHRPAGTQLDTGNLRTTVFGQKNTRLVFDGPTRWHKLTESGGVWMTDLPIEQRQTDELILSAQGHVLVGGLGLGYAAVALANRAKVRSVTVIEKSSEVIDLTWDATLAVAKYPYKLKVIRADLFIYLTTVLPKQYNWGLYDIWTTDGEHTFHEIVLPLRRLSFGKVKQVVCWNEDVMRGQLMMGIQNRLRLVASNIPGLTSQTLDELCEPIDSVYQDWAVPFWRKVRDFIGKDALADREEDVMMMARHYVQHYGMKETHEEQEGRLGSCRVG